MKIGIDIRPLQGETQYRGIGQALGYLLEALLRTASDEHSFVFYVDKASPEPELLASFPDHTRIAVPAVKLGQKRYLRSVLPSYRPVRPRNREVDVFLQYDAALGVPVSVPSVAVFHDLIPLLFRGQEKKQATVGVRKYKNVLAGSLYWQKYLRTFDQYKRARAIITISEASKQDYRKYVSKQQSITVIHHGVSDFRPNTSTSSSAKELTKQPYLLYVGGIDLRKNVVGLLQDFYTLKADFPALRLLAIGKEFGLDSQLGDLGWHDTLAAQPEYAKDVITPGFIADTDLGWLYTQAVAFVFPSRYEGFGLPILEAMQAGCPVVAYDNSSIPEVAGDAALLAPDGTSLVPAIRQLLEDSTLRHQLIAKGQIRAKQFTWERTAKETLKVLITAANQQR